MLGLYPLSSLPLAGAPFLPAYVASSPGFDFDLDLNIVDDPVAIDLNRRDDMNITLNVAVKPKEINLG